MSWTKNSPPKLGGVPELKARAGWFPFGTTPSAPAKVASRLFLDGAATPPNLGGELRVLQPFGNRPFSRGYSLTPLRG